MPEIIKETVKTNQVVPPQRIKNAIDFDCVLPDSMPDISSVLAADGACSVTEVTAENGKVNVSYTIHYKILYLTQESAPLVKAYNSHSTHTATVEIPQICESSVVYARCALEHTEYSLTSSRKINVRSVVKIIADGSNTLDADIPVDVGGIAGLQTKFAPFSFSAISECIDTTLELCEASELGGGKPSIGSILRSDPSICDITVAKNGDTITVKGNLSVCTLYVSDDEAKRLEIIESHIPFTHGVAATYENSDPSLSVRSEIKAFRAEIGEDEDGLPRIIDVKADVRFNIIGYTNVSGEMLCDAYSLEKAFTLNTREIEVFTRKDDVTAQFVIKEPLSVEGELPPIKEVVDITGQIGQADVTVEDDAIIVEGYVVCSALYISDSAERPLVSCKKQIPFSHVIEKRGLVSSATVPLRLYVSHTSFSLLSPAEMELRIAVAARGEIIENKQLTVICDISDVRSVSECMPHRPSILVYIVQPGDTLWKIAKRYCAPIEALTAINDIKNPDMIMPGDKLLISC